MGASAATDLKRMVWAMLENGLSAREISRARYIKFEAVLELLAEPKRTHLCEACRAGGSVPVKTWSGIIMHPCAQCHGHGWWRP